MSNKYLDILTQVVRNPRHAIGQSHSVRIEIERAQPSPADSPVAAPEVLDFSRGGCRLRLTAELRKNEPLVLRIADGNSGLALELLATVRWSHAAGEQFEAGCQFDNAVDFEELGELFLAGFLSPEVVAAT